MLNNNDYAATITINLGIDGSMCLLPPFFDVAADITEYNH